MTTLMGYIEPRRLGAADEPRAGERTRTVALWTAQIASAGIFLLTGISKLAGAAVMVQMFEAIGIGQWFRYLTGLIEVVSGLLLLVPSLAFFGAVALAATMVGAILVHLFLIGGNPALPILLLAMTTAVAWMRRSERCARWHNLKARSRSGGSNGRGGFAESDEKWRVRLDSNLRPRLRSQAVRLPKDRRWRAPVPRSDGDRRRAGHGDAPGD